MYQHPKPSKPEQAPAKANPIQYGAKVHVKDEDTTTELSPAGIKHIQDVVGTFAWYSCASDPTMTATLSSIASRQSKANKQLNEEVTHCLSYCSTHPNAGIRDFASDIILALHSVASYLSEPNSKSRAAGHFYIKRKSHNNYDNGTILTLSKTIKHVMTSASEAKLAALLYNCRGAISLRISLEKMVNPQPKTPAVSDNTTAHRLI